IDLSFIRTADDHAAAPRVCLAEPRSAEEVRLLVNELSNCHYPALFDSSSGQDVALRLPALSDRDAGFQRLPPARLETRTKESNDPKDGELCLSRVKPGETLVEARSDTDVQIVRQTW
ncbi:hypothetical protein FOZ62_020340, partial [Perkinsus olseni]